MTDLPEADTLEPNCRALLTTKLNEPAHEAHRDGMHYVYRSDSSNATRPDGLNIPDGTKPRTVRPVSDGLSKIGFVQVDGRLQAGGGEYTEIAQNAARSVPETELYELLEACGQTQTERDKKFLTTIVIGDLAALAEIGDMVNIAAYTALALDSESMNRHENFTASPEGAAQIEEALSLILHPEGLEIAMGDGETANLNSLLPSSIQELFGACRTDAERMDVLLFVAQAKQWASGDTENIRNDDKDKMRAKHPAVKMAIVLNEQDLMEGNLSRLVAEHGEMLNGQTKAALQKIITTSREKRASVREQIKNNFSTANADSQPTDYLHLRVLPTLAVADDGIPNYLDRLDGFVASMGQGTQ